jgi:hypothetical protein
MSSEEREEVMELMEDILHHRIIHGILDILPEEHHDEFVILVSKNTDGEEPMRFLKGKTEYDPEIKIITTAEMVKKEILLEVLLCNPRKKK